ncbi:MAG TPA: CHC2 zinc finger domain-containing protein [Gemmataceae bacterium]|nr:CHC2 zinc finger domain-containing protein [Gemmataceae bacterium]
MPGVNFDRLRAEITMEEVLRLLAFAPTGRSGWQWYGPCPFHPATAKRSRCFSVNVALRRYYCHRCHRHGNHLELWAAASQLPLYQAAIDLCQRLGRDVPWMQRW